MEVTCVALCLTYPPHIDVGVEDRAYCLNHTLVYENVEPLHFLVTEADCYLLPVRR